MSVSTSVFVSTFYIMRMYSMYQAWPFQFQQASGQSLASVGLGEPFFPKQKFAFKTSLNQREEVHRAFKLIL